MRTLAPVAAVARPVRWMPPPPLACTFCVPEPSLYIPVVESWKPPITMMVFARMSWLPARLRISASEGDAAVPLPPFSLIVPPVFVLDWFLPTMVAPALATGVVASPPALSVRLLPVSVWVPFSASMLVKVFVAVPPVMVISVHVCSC
jgi:hypothetical protein